MTAARKAAPVQRVLRVRREGGDEAVSAVAPVIRDLPLEEIVARLMRAVSATRRGVLAEVDDMFPALERLTELLALAPVFTADKTRRLVELEREMARAGMERSEIAAAIQERLGMSPSTYYRHRATAIEAGAIPADSQKMGTDRE